MRLAPREVPSLVVSGGLTDHGRDLFSSNAENVILKHHAKWLRNLEYDLLLRY